MISAIIATIKKYDRIFVYRHTNPDPDAIGTQFGLVTVLQQTFPAKMVMAMGAVPPALQWLSEPISTTITATADDLVIVVDCANQKRIDGRLPAGAPVIKIDHHPNRDPYGDLNWVDEQVASCAELIARLAQTAQLTVTPIAATQLYAGIIGDTVRFSTPETTAQTLQTATDLVAVGVDVAKVSHHEMDLTPALSKLFGYVLSEIQVDAAGLGQVILTQAQLTAFGLLPGEEDAVVKLPGQLTNVAVWLLFIEQPDGQYRVHFRSKSLAIDSVAQVYHGGGHPLASGAFIPDLATVQSVVQHVQVLMKKES
ncbi:bifunctional oligoribonuclease/PAP phosphatase NrnA [Lactobacillus sp. CBA3605]|uniref:DHH family phosphoesterase n=1 Tax=Lactobacillus sp. CBA3605 TaxID=2099788 RepID=UPI001F28D179|nr:bifunctional oligoribonuclease/PAP phosphatase NrnA [Lactobacillus sp. CBA3605]